MRSLLLTFLAFVLVACAAREAPAVPTEPPTPLGLGSPPHPNDPALTPPAPGAFGLTAPFKPRDPQQGSEVGGETTRRSEVPVTPGTSSSSGGE